MTTNANSTGGNWTDPVDAPRLTAEWFEGADVHKGGKLVRGRGRPKLDNPKRQVSLRLDPDVIERWKASGPGWQSRVNDMLRKAVGL